MINLEGVSDYKMKIFGQADILIPQNEELESWSVVACDQYTSQEDYWDEVYNKVGDKRSTLKLIFPEIYLECEDAGKRIESINKYMNDYISENVFKELKNSYVLTARTQRDGRTRYGIVGQVDLEQYDFSKGSSSYIRATEGTVIERIPPRVKVRENASLELPHIIMLIDDANRGIIEPLRTKLETFEKIYDFDLMMDSGHLTGYILPDAEADRINNEILKMSKPEYFNEKYGVSDKGVLLFAVGDGNHSLATAKTVWENVKKNLSEEEKKTHPARFALCELMNIHDDALEFEPIHRVVFDADESIIKELNDYANSLDGKMPAQEIKLIYKGCEQCIKVNKPVNNLTVGTLQAFLDEYIREHGNKIDYIHGEDTVRELSKGGNVGFILPEMEKKQLFETIIHDGVLPRKTFSMGEAEDKRFYMECKKIK